MESGNSASWNLAKSKINTLKMPPFYSMLRCSNDKKKFPHLSFCRVPTVITNQGETIRALSEERRRLWLAAISRADLTEKKLKNDRVCGIHFKSGCSAKLWDRKNDDWVPSLKLGHNKLSKSINQGHDNTLKQERAQRVTDRRKRQLKQEDDEIRRKVEKLHQPVKHIFQQGPKICR